MLRRFLLVRRSATRRRSAARSGRRAARARHPSSTLLQAAEVLPMASEDEPFLSPEASLQEFSFGGGSPTVGRLSSAAPPEEPEPPIASSNNLVLLPELPVQEGIWYRANNLGLPIDATTFMFNTFEEAERTASLLASLNHNSIPRLLFLDDCNNSFQLYVERIPSCSIRQWMDKDANELIMWTLNKDGTQYLELNVEFQTVFRSIARVLSFMHEGGKYHGRLLEGIWVSETNGVMLANFDTGLDFEKGFQKDMDDFKRLVQLAVAKHSQGIAIDSKEPKEPPALASFIELVKRLQNLEDFEEMREFAYFVYCAPLFWSWRDRYKFISKMEEYSAGVFRNFFKFVMEDERQATPRHRVAKKNTGAHTYDPKIKERAVMGYALPRLANWEQRITSLPQDAPLRMVYEFRPDLNRHYWDSGGILTFHNNVKKHYIEGMFKEKESNVRYIPPHDLQSADYQTAFNDLLEVFPEAIPDIYDRVVLQLWKNEEIKKTLDPVPEEEAECSQMRDGIPDVVSGRKCSKAADDEVEEKLN